MKLTNRKVAIWGLVISFSVSFMFLSYGLINSLSCSYKLNLIYSEESQVHLICRAGKITAIHSTVLDGSKTVAHWKVSARQILIGNQLIYVIWNRERIQRPQAYDAQVDRYNYSVKDFSTLFYFTKRRGDELVIFEKFPDEDVYVATIKGKLGFIEPD